MLRNELENGIHHDHKAGKARVLPKPDRS